MSELKVRIPSEDALRTVVDACAGSLVTEVRKQVGGIEKEYIKHRRRQRIGAVLVVVAFAILQLADIDLDVSSGNWEPLINVVSIVFVTLLLPLIGVLLFVGYKLYKTGNVVVQQFHNGVNRVLFSKGLSLLSLRGSLLEHSTWQAGRVDSKVDVIAGNGLFDPVSSPETAQVLELLAHSELITEAFNVTSVDNMFHIDINHRPLFIAELAVKNVTGSGRNRHEKNIFKGYFVSFELSRTLEGKTFVSTEGDERGFGHQSFWMKLIGSELRETTLEWNEFEDLLHVATTNEVEARYVLTTNFMLDLYEWWRDKKVNIRLSFIANRLYILFPDSAVRFNDTVPKIEERALSEYLYTITKPLYHVVCLIEDVKL